MDAASLHEESDCCQFEHLDIITMHVVYAQQRYGTYLLWRANELSLGNLRYIWPHCRELQTYHTSQEAISKQYVD